MELSVGLGILSSRMWSHSGMGKVPPSDNLR